MDARKAKNLPSGRGLAFSGNLVVGDRWVPFLRAAMSEGGNAKYTQSVTAGVGLNSKKRGAGRTAIGLNWSRPSPDFYGPGLRDQLTIELYTRRSVLGSLVLTPSKQVIKNPALAPTKDWLGVIGFRARVKF